MRGGRDAERRQLRITPAGRDQNRAKMRVSSGSAPPFRHDTGVRERRGRGRAQSFPRGPPSAGSRSSARRRRPTQRLDGVRELRRSSGDGQRRRTRRQPGSTRPATNGDRRGSGDHRPRRRPRVAGGGAAATTDRGRVRAAGIASSAVRGKRARTGSCVAARGTTTPGTCARPTATRTTPATATPTWGSAWPERRRRPEGLHLIRPITRPSGRAPGGKHEEAPTCS